MADEKEWHVFLKPVPKEKVFEVDIKGILDKFMQEGNAFKSEIENSEHNLVFKFLKLLTFLRGWQRRK